MAKHSISKRLAFWFSAGLFLILAGGAALFVFFQRPAVVPFYGPHQSGISTPSQKFAFVAAFDLTTVNGAEVRDLFQRWSRAASELTQGLALDDGPQSVPPTDTGETVGYKPARLTVTFGVGPSLFDARFGLADQRPTALSPIPPFPGDNLNPQWSDGDLVIQVCADDFQTAYHALHNLTRLAKGVAVPRWVQAGFKPGLEVDSKGPGRNLEGFNDGTVNPDSSDPASMDKEVWVDQGPGWMKGGTYLVVRRIRMFVETWDRSSLADQEKTIGRSKSSGLPLTTQAENSHVRLARGDGVEKIFRRPFNYVNGLDPRTGQWDSGLLFLAWMKDPGRQYIPPQTRLSQNDALNEYIQPVGSAIFAVFPGVASGDSIGSGLFPSPTLTQRIETLQSQIGGFFTDLGRQDWKTLRVDADSWNKDWQRERASAGAMAAAIDSARDAWVGALAAEHPDGVRVKQAQTELIKSLSAWESAVTPRSAVNTSSLDGLKASLKLAAQSLAAHDNSSARKSFADFQNQWSSHEALVRSLSESAYSQLELLTGQARRALQVPETSAIPLLQQMSGQLDSLQPPRAYSAWDAGIILFREGLEALLVLAALLAFLGRTGQKSRVPWVWSGAILGLGSSVAVALLVSVVMTGWLASSAPELVEGLTGLAAVVLMLTVGAWLHGKSAIKDWNLWLKARMNQAGNSGWALGGLWPFSPSSERAPRLSFFFGGMAGALPLADLLVGISGGLIVLVVLGTAMIGFSKRLPLQIFFPLATLLIYFLAVKILGQSLGSLHSSGWLTATPLGFGGLVSFIGFTPTWETSLPQLVLTLALVATLVLSMRKKIVPPQVSRLLVRDYYEKKEFTMFITEKMITAFNAQVGHEFANALQYLAIANWFESEDLRLLAKLYNKQADEELVHAKKISQFLIDSGAKVRIPELGSFVNDFASAVEAAQLAYDAEVRTTQQIHELVALAQAEKCPSASQMLQWFVEEQVEEIATAQRNLNIIKKSGNNVFLMEAYLAHGSE